MEKSKLLTITVVGLLLLNLGTLSFLFFNGSKPERMHHDGRKNPKEIIIEKLHLDNNQQIEFEKLIQIHRSEISKLDANISQKKNELYLLLNENTIDEKAKVTLIDEISQLQRQIEAIHFKHFEDIKKLCKPEQKEDFKLLTQEFSKIFGKRKNHKPQDE